jgi:hypothetical protein
MTFNKDSTLTKLQAPIDLKHSMESSFNSKSSLVLKKQKNNACYSVLNQKQDHHHSKNGQKVKGNNAFVKQGNNCYPHGYSISTASTEPTKSETEDEDDRSSTSSNSSSSDESNHSSYSADSSNSSTHSSTRESGISKENYRVSTKSTKIIGQQIIVGKDGPYGVFMNRSGAITLQSNQFDDIVVRHTNTIDPSAVSHSTNSKDRYKTEMCWSWDETGYCRYGDKCQYAHGEHELREVTRHHKYKSELCNNYHYEGTCMYGIRCCFIHKVTQEDVGRALSQNIDVVPLKRMKRLAIFQQICAAYNNNKDQNVTSTNEKKNLDESHLSDSMLSDHSNIVFKQTTEQPQIEGQYRMIHQGDGEKRLYYEPNHLQKKIENGYSASAIQQCSQLEPIDR